MAEMKQWEYRAVSLGSFWNYSKDEDLEAAMNELGLEGWEVISVFTHHSTNKTFVVAKRPLDPDEARRRRRWIE
jgi:hypothetical protein